MAAQPPQTYENHAHRPVMSFVAGLLALVALGLFAVEVARRPGPLAFGLLCVTFAVLLLVSISRIYILRLQNRIIRLEMRIRLARLGREADHARLSTQQLVALRFASDEELPALAQRALAENLTGTQVKQAVRNWQPDYHRT